MKNSRVQTAACLFGSLVFLMFATNADFLHAAMPLQDAIAAASLTVTGSAGAGSGPSIGVNPNPIAHSNEPANELLSIHTLIKTLMISSIFVAGMNVAKTGKKGWGWKTLALLITVIFFIAKCILSMFVEVTANNSIADWDEE